MTQNLYLKINQTQMKFNLRHCRVSISFPFLTACTILVLTENNNFMICALLPAAFHEFGHIFAMFLKKYKPHEINVRLFSVDIIDNSRIYRDYNSDIFILFLGPLTNIFLGTIFFILYRVLNVSWFVSFSYGNLFLAFFNLLPIEPLDGGQILFNLLIRRIKLQKAEKLISLISVVFLFPVAILGFYVLLTSKYNFSLLFLSCYLMCILLLKSNSWYY